MKAPSRFTLRALLALAATAAIGVAGACKDSTQPPPPPPPPPLAAPTNLTASAASTTQINLAWSDNSTTEEGFRIESCAGASCTNFAEIATVAANVVTYQNTGLAASTAYNYRVRAFLGTTTSDFSTPASALTPDVPPPAGAVFVGAGEITSCASVASGLTAGLIDGVIAQNPNATVYTVGNNLADTLTPDRSYQTCFDPRWGKFKDRMRAAVGQMDFASVGTVASVYDYFGDKAGAPNGWYSFDVGTSWHVIVLNTSTWQHGTNNVSGDTGPSVMHEWLASDLAANKMPCVLAISWERRIYTTAQGSRGRQGNMLRIANMLYAAGVDVLVSAKDKLYARFPQVDPQGVKNEANGFRQFLVGTGGRSLDQIVTPAPSATDPISPVEAQSNTWGVLKFTLNAASYSWEFIPTTAGGFTDSGTTACH